MLKKRMATGIFVIALALGIALLFPACNKNKSGKQSYDYSKILKGDLSEFSASAGYWENSSNHRQRLTADGLDFDHSDGWVATDFSLSPNGSYGWVVNPEYRGPENSSGYGVDIFPIGVDIYDYNKELIQTDKTKVRMFSGREITLEEIYYFYPQKSDITAASVTWRKEFEPGGINMGTMWTFDKNSLYFEDDADMDLFDNPKEKNMVIAYSSNNQHFTYKLVSKDDKPTNQVSSFTIEDKGSKKYTIKYTLGAGRAKILTIVDLGGLESFVPKGTYIQRYYGHDDTGEKPYYDSYLQQLETAIKEAKDENAGEWQIKEIESAITQLNQWWAKSTTVSMGNTKNYYYATTNLRLITEPDTSKDNKIADVPQGSRVEMIELGNSETIDNINARWFKVRTDDGTTGWLFSGYLSLTTPAPAESYDYAKILNKDFSDFAGNWKNGNGDREQLKKDGIFGVNGKEIFTPKRESNGAYSWIVGSGQDGWHMKLYPVGTTVPDVQSDTTKVRLTMVMTPDGTASQAEIYYKD